jgi:hypothetical protein
MSLLDQTEEERARDRCEQAERQARARSRGLVPRKDARTRDFIERSIEEVKRQLAAEGLDDEERSRLADRAAHLNEELTRLS